jgi:hypothetical protein
VGLAVRPGTKKQSLNSRASQSLPTDLVTSSGSSSAYFDWISRASPSIDLAVNGRIDCPCSLLPVAPHVAVDEMPSVLSRNRHTLITSKRSPVKMIWVIGLLPLPLSRLRYSLTSIQRISPSDVRITSITG